MSIKFVARLAGCLVLASVFSLLSIGQATPSSSQDSQKPDSTVPAPAQDQPAAQSEADKDKKPQDPNGKTRQAPAGTSNDRLFYALPNFLTLEKADKVPPLTAKQKFAVVARGTFDPIQYPWWALLSGIDQADNSEPAYGQGWGAYGKRYLTTAADSTLENFMVGAVFPSVLHQDPRFYQSGKGGFARRTVYAVTRIVVTRGDSGHAQFNFSEVFGSAFSAAVSNYSYHPRSTYISTPANPHLFVGSDRTLSNAVSVWGTQVTLDTITIVVKEFWPDIHRKISRKHKVTPAAGTGE